MSASAPPPRGGRGGRGAATGPPGAPNTGPAGGARGAGRAQEKAADVGARGATNEDAVRGVDVVVLAVKADAALPTAESLADAIGATPVLSVASELRFTKEGVFPTEETTSIAERTQAL